MPPEEFRQRLFDCLGGPWPDPPPLEPELRQSIPKDGYRIESVTYQVEPGDRLPALLLVPDGVDAEHRAPAIAVWHQHAGQWHLGKSEPAGLAGDPAQHSGAALARLGYVVLCPDALCFEERRDALLEGMAYERFRFLKYLVEGKCLAWKNILDCRRAIDYLCSRPEVDAARIGCYGHSLGSTFTWLLGPWEPRLACLVGNCCLPSYAAIHRTHLLHSYSNFIPGLLQYGDTPDIAALIAPRPLHLNFGAEDPINPLPEVREAVAQLQGVYAAAGAAEKFTYLIEDGQGHMLSEGMWARVVGALARWLGEEDIAE